MAHCIQRVREENQDRVRRLCYRRLRDITYDRGVYFQEVVPAHPRLPGQTTGYYYYVAVGRILPGVGPCNLRIGTYYGHRLQQVESFALWHSLYNVEQHNIYIAAQRQPMG